MNLIGLRVFLNFYDAHDRRVNGAPFGAFVGVVHSRFHGPGGSLWYYVILEEFLLLHRGGAQFRGEVVAVAPDSPSRVQPGDPIAESIRSSGSASCDAILVRSPSLPADLSKEMLDEDERKPQLERQFIHIGFATVSISKTGVPPLTG